MKDKIFRIRKIDEGYIVEYKKKCLFKNKWLPFITYNGSNEAYPFYLAIKAENALLMKVKNKLIDNEWLTQRKPSY